MLIRIIAGQPYREANGSLQFCRDQKIDRKGGAPARFAFDLDCSAMSVNDGLRQGEPQSDALGVFGKAASVKTFENVMDVIRMYPASVVLDLNVLYTAVLTPADRDDPVFLGMIQRIFHDISQGFG